MNRSAALFARAAAASVAAVAAVVVSAAGCTSGTSELGPGVISNDAGLPPPPPPPPPADAGMPPVEPHGCMLGWVTVAEATPGSRITGLSFAAQPDGFALIYDDDLGTWIAFYDAYGELRAPASSIGDRSRVIAYEGGFLRGGSDGLERYDVGGKSLERADHFFSPLAIAGRRVWGLNSDNYISMTGVGPLADMGSFAVGVSGAYRTIGFSEDRFVIHEDSQNLDEPSTVRMFEVGPRAAVEVRSERLPNDLVDGERHLGHALGAAVWNETYGRFDLLVGMRLGPTRQFGARLMHFYPDRGLVDGTPLYLPPAEVAYESLIGAAALSANGTLALAYRSPFNASELELDLVRFGAVEHFEVQSGASYPTNALLATAGDRFAVVYGTGASGTNTFENKLQLRCDIPAERESCGSSFCGKNERCNAWTRICQPLDVAYPPPGEDNGGHCTMDSECKSNGGEPGPRPMCMTFNSADYCTSRCALPADFGVPSAFERSDCPEGSLCFATNQFNWDGAIGTCVRGCTSDAECRTDAGYYCRRNIDGRIYENGYCAPAHCQTRGCGGYDCSC